MTVAVTAGVAAFSTSEEMAEPYTPTVRATIK